MFFHRVLLKFIHTFRSETTKPTLRLQDEWLKCRENFHENVMSQNLFVYL